VHVVIAHPHPDYGGDRHNAVVVAIASACERHGLVPVRFDMTTSTALDDITAAIRSTGDGPIVLAGYSFGAEMVSCIEDARVAAWALVACPFAIVSAEQRVAAHDERPKLVLTPEHDQFCPPDRVAVEIGAWTATEHRTIPGTDHFMGGRVTWVADEVVGWLTGPLLR
jgi:uncharacterized protein